MKLRANETRGLELQIVTDIVTTFANTQMTDDTSLSAADMQKLLPRACGALPRPPKPIVQT